MIDLFSAPVLVVGTLAFGAYKLFELFVCKRERVMLIEKLDPSQLPNFSGFKPFDNEGRVRSGALTIGCLLLGLGLGLLVGAMIICIPSYIFDRTMMSIIFSGSILLFGGLGLIVAFVIERKLMRRKE